MSPRRLIPCVEIIAIGLIIFCSATICAQTPGRVTGTVQNGRAVDAAKGISLLSIGISRYQNVPALEYTASDAIQVGDAYREIAQLDDTDVQILTDAEHNANITESALASHVRNFLQTRERNSTVVVFFGGHGFRTADGNFFLVPSDFDSARPTETGFALDEFRNMLSACPARTKIVILDCCFAGAFGAANRQVNAQNGNEVAGSFRTVPGCVAITASTGGQESIESPVLKAGIFTHWLVKGLRGQANTRIDNVIDAAELFSFVSVNVKRETNEAQTPSWSLDQAAEMPVVIPLIRPDRPSDRVGLLPFPLGADEQILDTVVLSVEQFPAVNPRRSIGLMKWVLSKAERGSGIARRAQKQLDLLNNMILSGKVQLLDQKEDGELDL